MGEFCARLARLHVKYRSLVPEFLWPWPGSLRHFVLLTLGAVVFLSSSSTSSSTSLTKHKHKHTARVARAKSESLGCVAWSKLLLPFCQNSSDKSSSKRSSSPHGFRSTAVVLFFISCTITTANCSEFQWDQGRVYVLFWSPELKLSCLAVGMGSHVHQKVLFCF